ncbi:MAG: hypothetical protein IJM30_05555 [Thermoguttaceae bacterium]|nr:hypothetical protein [Thermoguttaceae bacterium]
MKRNFIQTLALALFAWVAAVAIARSEDSGEYFEKTFFAPDTPVFGRLQMDAEWKIWIPADVETLRGVIVHQHGCGTGSSDGGRTAVYDLHWQALAREHDCALIAVSYRQGDLACELWCDPRNGSAQSFLDALEYFADYTGHKELTRIPWALWGHSGGGHWVGSMCQLYPKRIAGAWLRSGCPNTVGATFDELPMNEDVLNVPMMLNIGAHENGVEFAIVWNSCWPYFETMRSKGAKIGLLIDPNTSHETGNSRYPAIRFLHDCLSARLPKTPGESELLPPPDGFVLAESNVDDLELAADKIKTKPQENFREYSLEERRAFVKDGIWMPNKEFVDVWRTYARDGSFNDSTPPPAPFDAKITSDGALTWNCRADLESGLKTFVLYCDGERVEELPTAPVCNALPAFQGIMYSDTPDFSLPKFEWSIKDYDNSKDYSITAVNTCGLESDAASINSK